MCRQLMLSCGLGVNLGFLHGGRWGKVYRNVHTGRARASSSMILVVGSRFWGRSRRDRRGRRGRSAREVECRCGVVVRGAMRGWGK